MDDQLKIIIQALIDKQKTESQINAQIKQIKTEALKIGVTLDDKTVSSALKEQNKLAKEALHKAEEERDKHINIVHQEKAKIISLETAVAEMQLRLKTSHNDISRLQSEIEKIKELVGDKKVRFSRKTGQEID